MEWRRSARIFSSHDKRTKQLAEMIVCYSESGSGKGGPASRRYTLSGWMHCADPESPHTRKPATLFRPTEKPSPPGRLSQEYPALPRRAGTSASQAPLTHKQTGGILRTQPCCLRPRTASLRNGSGCGITSGIKRHFRLMNGTRKSILYAIGCFAGFYIL